MEKVLTSICEASSNISPIVFYEEKVIHGPMKKIGLEENKSIIIIGIPKSLNTPHIHS